MSRPVGTTVRVVDFLKCFPVRRQAALKDVTKLLNRIRKSLQAYAMARPSIRFSLKVLKAKNEKYNWAYAPKSGASVTDAATKIFGKKLTDQCNWLTWTSPVVPGLPEDSEGDDQMRQAAAHHYRIEALLPKPKCGESRAAALFT